MCNPGVHVALNLCDVRYIRYNSSCSHHNVTYYTKESPPWQITEPKIHPDSSTKSSAWNPAISILKRHHHLKPQDSKVT